MRLRVFSALLPAALVACAPSAPPADAPAPSTSTAADVPPVLALLSERERLDLEPRQVVELESIARQWETANDTLTRRVGAARGRGASPLRMMLGKQARLSLLAMAENNRRAALAVGQVLTPDQRQRLCTVQRLRGETAAIARTTKGREDAAPSATGTKRGAARTLIANTRRTDSPRAWPWCASTKPRPVETQSAN